ncbi:CTR copper uptake transporter [Mycena albidolilacea]|uniref:Copper transport protein n=1 Tax=Mycena albidolilacea TaxID=1033008 RepID=A0AAD7EFQ5_9AGAR|nr:CTR copper uptake transporter [Mycena albidolilacea]
MSLLALPALLLWLLPLVRGQVNGMDMSMDDGMTLASGMMMPYLHFTRGDILWFAGWVPQSAGALAGACIGLFILAIVDRWLAAVRGMMEAHWREAAAAAAAKSKKTSCGGDDADDKGKKKLKRRLRAPPFIPAHDITRGALHALQTLLGFAFMLAVMTFQASYIITLVLGLGVGEMLFGRYAAAAAMH